MKGVLSPMILLLLFGVVGGLAWGGGGDGFWNQTCKHIADLERHLLVPLFLSGPDVGWRGLERARLERRGTPDLALALALIHHVVITGNVPVREFVAWLRSLDCALVIEFPDREDPMVQKLLSGKTEKANPDFERETFERALGERFEVERTERLGTRTLYEVRPRP